jgi:bifunctional DNA-binding transcriptional regulator/antitoxin component of YhaV-PrlF toxin-antitoxin module
MAESPKEDVMETTTTVNSDGTVTIPADIRELYGILEGAQVHCIMNGYQLEMRIVGTSLPELKTKFVSGYGMIKSDKPSVDPHFGI